MWKMVLDCEKLEQKISPFLILATFSSHFLAQKKMQCDSKGNESLMDENFSNDDNEMEQCHKCLESADDKTPWNDPICTKCRASECERCSGDLLKCSKCEQGSVCPHCENRCDFCFCECIHCLQDESADMCANCWHCDDCRFVCGICEQIICSTHHKTYTCETCGNGVCEVHWSDLDKSCTKCSEIVVIYEPICKRGKSGARMKTVTSIQRLDEIEEDEDG